MPKPSFQYEPVEAFGESLTTAKPWNKQALVVVERLNGRVAMVGFTAAVVGEWISGEGITGQLLGVLQWYLNLG